MDYEGLVTYVGNATYGAQAIVALWGAYCVVMVWRRVAEKRFRSEEAQIEFLTAVDARFSDRAAPADLVRVAYLTMPNDELQDVPKLYRREADACPRYHAAASL